MQEDDVGRRRQTAFRNADDIPGKSIGQFERTGRVCVKRAEVAVIDTHHIHIVAHVVKFLATVHFEQHFKPQFVRLVRQGAAFAGGEYGSNEQHGIGTARRARTS